MNSGILLYNRAGKIGPTSEFLRYRKYVICFRFRPNVTQNFVMLPFRLDAQCFKNKNL